MTALGIAALVSSAWGACDDAGKSNGVGTLNARHDAGVGSANDEAGPPLMVDSTSDRREREAGSDGDSSNPASAATDDVLPDSSQTDDTQADDADVDDADVDDADVDDADVDDADVDDADVDDLSASDDSGSSDDASSNADDDSSTDPTGSVSEAEPADCGAVGGLTATDEQIAINLSRALFGASEPDARLTQAAEEGRLTDPIELEIVIRELLDDPEVLQRLSEFATWWLSSRVGQMPYVGKDAERFPAFDGGEMQAAVLAAMQHEGELFLQSQLQTSNSNLTSVLTDSYTYVNQLTAEYYGLQVSGESFERVSLPPEQRFGLLSQLYFLTTRSHDESDPIARGAFVRQRLLCQEIPNPPPNLALVGPTYDGTTTTREFYEAWVADPVCWACHRYFTQLGFSFENFDAVGRYRSDENGFAVDSSTTLEPFEGASSVDFDGAAQLLEHLSRDPTAQRCFTQQWGLFMLGRYPEHASRRAEQTALASLDFDGVWQAVSSCAVSGDELDLHEMLVAVASSPFVLEGSFSCGSTSCVAGQEICLVDERALDDGSVSRTEQCHIHEDASSGCEPFEGERCVCQLTPEGGVVVECSS